MEKTFKVFYVSLSIMLVVALTLVSCAVPGSKKNEFKFDFFGTEKIAENVRNMEMNMTSIVYVKDSNGEWEEYQRLHGDENRIWIGIDKIPKNLMNAFIAIEDETFREHKGINWKRTIGAAGNYFFKFDDTEFGGSTITQQLIKNVTLDKGKTAKRKVREIFRAMILERKLEKNEILEAYLNTIALGNGICGVQVAANYYFNKSVENLTLLECASLAAITQNPSRYNPVTGMEANKERRNTVLDKMLELGFIDEDEYNYSYGRNIKLDDSQKENYEAEINNYFIDALIEDVIGDLSEKYECTEEMASTMLYNGGFKIYATVDTNIQSIMEDVYTNVSKYFSLTGKNLSGEKVSVQSAMTIVDYNGHIVGLVGGAGEKTVNRGLNRAIDSPRQPGSTMKPIGVYALAIEKDLVHYTSKVLDQPIDNYYPDGKKGPKEWYGYYKGNITVDYAIRKSANTIPVRLLKDVGIEDSYKFLTEKLGCKHLVEEDKNLASLALGGCTYGMTTTESAGAYAIFGNQGVYHEPTTYYKIERVGGEIILEHDEVGEQVLSPATATIMNHLLQGVVYGSEGTGSGIRGFSSMKAFAKTGTSSESNDLWMVAGSPYYVGSVWYGFDKQQQVKSTSGAANIWRDVMKAVHKDLEKKEFVDSEDVVKKGSGYYKKDTKPDNLTTIGGSSSSEVNASSTPTPSEVTPPSTPSETTTPTQPESSQEGEGNDSGDGESSGTSSGQGSSEPESPSGGSADDTVPSNPDSGSESNNLNNGETLPETTQ